MVSITKDYFSIKQICESGQCFRLRRLDEKEKPCTEEKAGTGTAKAEATAIAKAEAKAKAKAVAAAKAAAIAAGDAGTFKYGLTAFGKYLEIEERPDEIVFHCSQEEFEQIWKGYFDLEEDYGQIISLIDEKDDYLLKAAAFGSGIRILRQDLWETIVSFIISQQNNIKRIRRCVDFLCEKYGEKRAAGSGAVYFDFPTPGALAESSLEDLYACNLGYRSRYIYNTAASIARGEVDLTAVEAMDYGEAKAALMKLCGVGVKVAECICLFALHKTEAFPVDTHIHKVLARQYPEGFPFERYKGHEGTLQQYIFYYDLMNG